LTALPAEEDDAMVAPSHRGDRYEGVTMRSIVRAVTAAAAATVLVLVAATPALAVDEDVLNGKGTFTAVALRSTAPVSCADGTHGELRVAPHWRGEEIVFSGDGFEVDSTTQQLDLTVLNSCTGGTTTLSGRVDNRGGAYTVADHGRRASIRSSVDVWGTGVAEFASVEVTLDLRSTSYPVHRVTTKVFVTGTDKTTVRTVTDTRAATAAGALVVHGSGIAGLDEVNLRSGATKVQGSIGTQTSRSVTRPLH
jgi:hypothetical protein